MLELRITLKEGLDEETNQFVATEWVTIQLEHSLISLSKWESKWEKPFLKESNGATPEMYYDYYVAMLLNPEDEKYLDALDQKNVEEINEYINSKQSAAWINDPQSKGGGNRGKTITSDLIYYWMVAMQIPFECQHWHLNRLITLIRITELEQRPKKNVPRKENLASHRALNQARRDKANQG